MGRWMIVSICACISAAVIGFGVWYMYMHETHTHPRVTVTAHPWCTHASYEHVRNVLMGHISCVQSFAEVWNTVEAQCPYLRGLTLKWQSASHVHATLRMRKPCLVVHTRDAPQLITQDGICVDHIYYAHDIYAQQPHITWNGQDTPHTWAHELKQVRYNIPEEWFHTYAVSWHGPHDIRLYRRDKATPHLRITHSTQISPQLKQQVRYIHRHAPQQTRWIDLRFSGRAIACPKLRGVNNDTTYSS